MVQIHSGALKFHVLSQPVEIELVRHVQGQMTVDIDHEIADVSAIIPCFNAVKTLERAVKSAAFQTFPVREIIIVDDGSTDDTPNLAESLRRELSERVPVHFFRLEKNQGPSAARNRGWERAQGRYVAFLDDDDAWHPRKIEIQYGYMKRHPDLVVSSHEFTLDEFDSTLAPEESEPVTAHGFEALLWRSGHTTPSLMIQTRVPERFSEGRHYMEDHLLLQDLAHRYGSVVRIEKNLCRLYKAQYGAAGLSSHLFPMFRGDVGNYWILRSKGYIGFLRAGAFSAYASLKYLRRLFIVARGSR